jgi:opacity protein-like surface antigen
MRPKPRPTALLRRPIALLGSVVAAALGAALPAGAETAPVPADHARAGAYVRLGVTLGVERYGWLEALDAEAAVQSAPLLATPGAGAVVTGYSTTTALGFELGAGYRLTRRLAVDASFEWAGSDLYVNVAERTSGARLLRSQLRRAELDTWISTLNGRVYLTTGRIQPFVVAGVGAMKATPIEDGVQREAHGFASRFGLGLDFWVTRRVAASAVLTYVLATGDTRGSDSIGFGTSITWRD